MGILMDGGDAVVRWVGRPPAAPRPDMDGFRIEDILEVDPRPPPSRRRLREADR